MDVPVNLEPFQRMPLQQVNEDVHDTGNGEWIDNLSLQWSPFTAFFLQRCIPDAADDGRHRSSCLITFLHCIVMYITTMTTTFEHSNAAAGGSVNVYSCTDYE